MKTYAMLVAFVVACFAAAAFGAAFPPGDWHAQLAKPSWNPPDWLFGPVWTALYLMMAIAGWLVWKRQGFDGAKLAFAVFGLQLIANALWSYLFFGMQRPDLAFYDIVLLWLLIASTVLLFWQHHRGAGVLLIPYLAWVSFAAALNWSIWQLNS